MSTSFLLYNATADANELERFNKVIHSTTVADDLAPKKRLGLFKTKAPATKSNLSEKTISIEIKENSKNIIHLLRELEEHHIDLKNISSAFNDTLKTLLTAELAKLAEDSTKNRPKTPPTAPGTPTHDEKFKTATPMTSEPPLIEQNIDHILLNRPIGKRKEQKTVASELENGDSKTDSSSAEPISRTKAANALGALFAAKGGDARPDIGAMLAKRNAGPVVNNTNPSPPQALPTIDWDQNKNVIRGDEQSTNSRIVFSYDSSAFADQKKFKQFCQIELRNLTIATPLIKTYIQKNDAKPTNYDSYAHNADYYVRVQDKLYIVRNGTTIDTNLGADEIKEFDNVTAGVTEISAEDDAGILSEIRNATNYVSPNNPSYQFTVNKTIPVEAFKQLLEKFAEKGLDVNRFKCQYLGKDTAENQATIQNLSTAIDNMGNKKEVVITIDRTNIKSTKQSNEQSHVEAIKAKQDAKRVGLLKKDIEGTSPTYKDFAADLKYNFNYVLCNNQLFYITKSIESTAKTSGKEGTLTPVNNAEQIRSLFVAFTPDEEVSRISQLNTAPALKNGESRQANDEDLSEIAEKTGHSRLQIPEKNSSSSASVIQRGSGLKSRLQTVINQEEMCVLHLTNPGPEAKNCFIWDKDTKTLSYRDTTGQSDAKSIQLKSGAAFAITEEIKKLTKNEVGSIDVSVENMNKIIEKIGSKPDDLWDKGSPKASTAHL